MTDPASASTKLTKQQRELLILISYGYTRTHVGSKREAELKAFEAAGLVYQGRRSYWYITDAGRAALGEDNRADPTN